MANHGRPNDCIGRTIEGIDHHDSPRRRPARWVLHAALLREHRQPRSRAAARHTRRRHRGRPGTDRGDGPTHPNRSLLRPPRPCGHRSTRRGPARRCHWARSRSQTVVSDLHGSDRRCRFRGRREESGDRPRVPRPRRTSLRRDVLAAPVVGGRPAPRRGVRRPDRPAPVTRRRPTSDARLRRRSDEARRDRRPAARPASASR